VADVAFNMDGARDILALIGDAKHFAKLIKAIEYNCDDNPALAVELSKTLIETACFTILKDRKEIIDSKTPATTYLISKVLSVVNLKQEYQATEDPSVGFLRNMCKNMGKAVEELVHLRDHNGFASHGRHASSDDLDPAQALLAARMADALVHFLFKAHWNSGGNLMQNGSTSFFSRSWKQHPLASKLLYANLLGAWSEQNTDDTVIVGKLVTIPFEEWISLMRDLLQEFNTPIQLKDGYWNVKDRLALWLDLGPRISDADLDRFRDCAITVLSEKSPKFELPSEQHYMANILGKIDRYSPSIRQGLSDTLALLGNYPDACSHASTNKRDSTALVVVRKVLESTDWILWGSLDDLLPLLAEAAPDTFLDAVEAALRHESNPYVQLFALEKSGISGTNYLTGLLWALETLAWEERYLARVTLILGHLAILDPGGNSSNRPKNSLITILLPWYPRTLAPPAKRKAAILSLKSDFPDQAWNLLLGLQSQFNQMSFGTRKPEWRKSVAKDWESEISAQEYEDQVLAYAEILVGMATEDDHRLVSIAEHLDRIPKRFFDPFMEHIIQRTELAISQEERNALWKALSEFAAKHRRHPDAKWALPNEALEKIEEAAKALEPQDPLVLYQRIFAKREMDLVPAGTSWEDANKQLEVQRRTALLELGSTAGVQGILQFALSVESPEKVGYTYGCISDAAIDAALLPEYLLSEDQATKAFVASYIWGRFQKLGCAWADQLDKSVWTIPQKVRFFTCLPSNGETWDRVTTLLATDEGEYWRAVHVNPYAQDCDLNRAIVKLLEYGRPRATVTCFKRLDDLHMPIDATVLAQTLLATVGSTESANDMDMYEVMELIKVLQKSPEALPNDIAKVEWAYLQLMRNGWGVSPQFLAQKLASDPVFFCEMVRRAYRSTHEEESKEDPSEQEQSMARNAYRLLQEWRTFPGTMPDGSLSPADLDSWLARVITSTQESGHLNVALRIIGRAAFHGPADPNGLWIHKTIAGIINANTDTAEVLQKGFVLAVFNSRGAHFVDASGQDDLSLASKYDQQSDDLETAGYPRFGTTIRKIADHYRDEALQNQSRSSDELQP